MFKMADRSTDEDFASYYDSDQFDEDSMSICSWFSEHNSVSAITWKGWKRNANITKEFHSNCLTIATSLVDLCAKVVAEHFPFQAVDEYQPPIPEQIQLKVAFWSFPQKEDNIQLYSCIAHGTMDEFHLAELILKWNNVKKVIQIGFHLTGVVIDSKLKTTEQHVAVTFDRCQIITCCCSCPSNSKWCSHVIALCLFRIRNPELVSFRVPLSESLSRLTRDQLQKFTQYLINELPPKVLPTAQELLDQLLIDPASKINMFCGAPDPTAGAGYIEEAIWNLDDEALRENIRKIIGRFCGPSTVAFVDLTPSFFASSAATMSDEWLNLMRPLISRDPEGIWNLFDIVKCLLRERDANSVGILQILTEEFLNFPQLPLWWFMTSTEANGSYFVENVSNMFQTHNNTGCGGYTRNAVAKIFDEIVELWKVIMIVPCVGNEDKVGIMLKLEAWHQIVLEKANGGYKDKGEVLSNATTNFSGFKPAIEAGKREWQAFFANAGINFDIFTDSNQCIIKRRLANNSLDLQDQHIEGYLEDLFSCVYALNTLGYTIIARSLAAQLAEALLAQFNFDHNHLSVAIKSAYICKVMKEASECHQIAFKLGVLGLAMPREPASTKLHEIRLAHCEINLRCALKMMSIGQEELDLIRSSLKRVSTACNTRKPQSKPLIFAIFVLEVLSNATVQSRMLTKLKNKYSGNASPTDDDKKLSYKFALEGLGWACCALDRDHAMLCECFRHFRNDLAETMLWNYRNSKEEINEILSLLLKLDRYFPGRDVGSVVKTADNHRLNKAQSEKYDDATAHFCSNETIYVPEDWDAEINASQLEVEKQPIYKPVMQFDKGQVEILCTDLSNDESVKLKVDDSRYASSFRCHLTSMEEPTDLQIENLRLGVPGEDLEKTDLSLSGAECDVRNVANERIVQAEIVTCKDQTYSSSESIDTLPLSLYYSTLGTKEDNECEYELCDKNHERLVLSASIDGRNTWDPAISWAETCESKSTDTSGANNESYKGYDVSSKGELFHIELRRHVDKIRLECDSYALFELAKNVLSKSSDDIGQAGLSSIMRPKKQLQLAAFEIAIFSLRLHNFISPKWLSRTYSSHVSWIADKCVDIGCAAVQKLNDLWENVLTPSEVIDISGKAYRAGDNLVRRACSELVVSCLPQSHALNPGEIQQAINMCKEQDIHMLESACVSVETASRNGGIQPEILFYVARQWHHIHEIIDQESGSLSKANRLQGKEKGSSDKRIMAKKEKIFESSTSNTKYNNKNYLLINPGCRSNAPAKAETDMMVRSKKAVLSEINDEKSTQSATLLTAEKYVQDQMHKMAEEMFKRSYLQDRLVLQGNPTVGSISNQSIHPQYQRQLWQSGSVKNVKLTTNQTTDYWKWYRLNLTGDLRNCETPIQLQNAFRVGLKALEALARKSAEERSDVKYSQSPPCSDDIRWLCALAASLGPSFLRKFCKAVISSVFSPYVLHDLALEAARHFAMYNPAQLSSYLRSPAVSPIVSKCLTMYSELIRRDLVLLNPVSYSQFVELLRRARSAFCMAPGGMTMFNELLEMIRKSCPKKGDLWQQIMGGLSRA